MCGRVVEDFTQVNIVNKVVEEGEDVKILIEPKTSVYQYGYVYDSNDKITISTHFHNCDSNPIRSM